MGAVTRARQRRRHDLGGARRRPIGRPHDRGVRPVAADLADRRRGPRLRRQRTSSTARTCAGPTATSSSGSSPPARRWTRPACRSGFEGELAERTGVILGTGLGGVGTLIDGISTNALRGPDRISPFLIPMGIPNIGAGQIAISFGMTGPNFTTVSACATGGHAIGEACGDHPARRRRRDARGRHRGRRSTRRSSAGSPRCARSRPATTTRQARVAAVRRGPRRVRHRRGRRRRRPRGARARRGARRDASSPSSSATARPPTPRTSRCPRRAAIGAVRAARRALEKAGHRARPTSTTSTPTRPRRPRATRPSCQAIRTIFGDARRDGRDHGQQVDARPHARAPPGAIEAIATILAIRDGCVPPTINLDDPDPEAEGLDLTPNVAAPRDDPGRRSATRSGSAARTRPSSSRGATHDRRQDAGRRPPPEAAAPAGGRAARRRRRRAARR